MDDKLKLYRQFKLLVMNLDVPKPKIKDLETIWDDGCIVGYRILIKVEEKPKLKIIKNDEEEN